jgi:hypothetical protein
MKIPVIASYVFVFVVTMLLYTHHNDFPFFYHTTEPSKIEQITVHNYNFNHPLLMLDAASAVAKVSGAKTEQEKVQAGRFVSAVFASLTVMFLMGCAHLLAGSLAAGFAGFLLSFSPMMIRLSHYFKEDPTFLFGVSLSFLAFILFYRKPGIKTLLFAAAAAALASSGKYVGLIFLPMGIFAAVRNFVPDSGGRELGKGKKIGLFVAAFLVVFLIVNIDMILYFSTIVERLSEKLSHTGSGNAGGIVALSGHGGARPASPILDYMKMFFTQTGFVIPCAALLYFAHFAFTFRKRENGEKFIVAFFFLFTGLLSLGKVSSGQYFLPQELLSHMFAAVVLCRLFEFAKARIGTAFSACGLSAAALVMGFVLFPYARAADAQFHPENDSRVKMIKWIESSSGNNASFLCDGYVLLDEMIKRSPSLSKRNDLGCERMEYAGDIGTIADAREKGFTHVAVADSTYGRFFNTDNVASAGAGGIFAKRRAFYEELFRKGALEWEVSALYGGVVNETLRIYRLPSDKKTGR